MAHAGGGRLPAYTWLLPALGVAAALALGKTGAAWAGAIVAVLIVGSVMGAVHHAEVLAERLGEPFGTLVLTLAVTIIEVSLIASMMLTGEPKPELARDSVHAVVILVLHGLAGLCILVGAIRHREQEFSTQGANAFLAVLLPMSFLVLVLPDHVITASGPYYSPTQLGFVGVVCLALYLGFLFIQTVRHQEYFVPPNADDEGHEKPSGRMAAISAGLLLLALVAVVLLAKKFAPFIDAGIAAVGAPAKIAGVIVAAIVLLPESAAAIKAARRDRLQTSINLALGSAVACIGLTVPVVAVLSLVTEAPLALGIGDGQDVLLLVSFLTAFITYGTGRTNLLAGWVHLVLFATWIFLIFVP